MHSCGIVLNGLLLFVESNSTLPPSEIPRHDQRHWSLTQDPATIFLPYGSLDVEETSHGLEKEALVIMYQIQLPICRTSYLYQLYFFQAVVPCTLASPPFLFVHVWRYLGYLASRSSLASFLAIQAKQPAGHTISPCRTHNTYTRQTRHVRVFD
jgi:hypothetical protein